MNRVVTDHAVKRYRERGTNSLKKKTATEERVRQIIDGTWQNAVRLDDPIRSEIGPWCSTVYRENILFFDKQTRLVFVCKQDGDDMVCVTLFRAVCKTCQRAECEHLEQCH